MNEKILAQKVEAVNTVKEKLNKSKCFVLIDYRGLSVAEDTALRAEFRKANVEYKVVKNKTLLKAFEQLGLSGAEDSLNGPTSIAISYEDVTAPAKIAHQNIGKLNKMAMKAGFCEGKLMNAKELTALANIPAKEVLIGQLLGLITSPMRSLAVVLNEAAKKLQN